MGRRKTDWLEEEDIERVGGSERNCVSEGRTGWRKEDAGKEREREDRATQWDHKSPLGNKG